MMPNGADPRTHHSQPRRAIIIAAALGALLCAVALIAAAPARCQEPARLALEPSAATITVGEEVTLTARVEEVVDLYGVDLRLGFDAAVLEVVDVDPDTEGVQSAPGRYPYPDLEARNEADNEAGTIWYMVTQLGAREAVSGTGTVVAIRLRGKGVGTGAVSVRQADLANNEGFMIPVETGDVTITVAEAPAGDAPGDAGASPIAMAAMGIAALGAAGALLLARGRREG